MDRGFEMGSDQEAAAAMEQHDGDVGCREASPVALSARKLWRMARAVHLVVVRGLGKHQPKLAALGVHLHHLLSPSSKRHSLAAAPATALMTYLSALSCRSVDPAAAVHPYYPHGRGGRITGSQRGGVSSLSCRYMDPGAAVYQKYQYRPREVEFSCSSTPLHRPCRRSRRRGGRLLQQQHDEIDPEFGSAAAVTRLFELMDDDDVAVDQGDAEMSGATAMAPRQVRITDSPFPAAREEEEGAGAVDRRADEFIVWFHDQLRMQQQQRPGRRQGARHVLG